MSSAVSPIRTGHREPSKRRPSFALPTTNRAPLRRHHSTPSIRWDTSHRRQPRMFMSCLHYYTVRARRLPTLLFVLLGLILVFSAWHLVRRSLSTLVFQREDLQRIWEWEIASGHYPSRAKIPEQIALSYMPHNPALSPSTQKLPSGPIYTESLGVGPNRDYLDIRPQPPSVAYPPRPIPGSIADLDIIMKHCDYSQKKYVRDCLEVLKVGAGLDTNARLRRGDTSAWNYIYAEHEQMSNVPSSSPVAEERSFPDQSLWKSSDSNSGLQRKRGTEWEPHLAFSEPLPYHLYSALPTPCDGNHPRLFHMFWVGPFTDKPYVTLLSFLFTQNLGLHGDKAPAPVCRPQLWFWISPRSVSQDLGSTTEQDMLDSLRSNPWASPFLHPRFNQLIKFKFWNLTEQLDGVSELRDEWRPMKDELFNSLGRVISGASDSPSPTKQSPSKEIKKSTVVSDMARFLLCHRFGGIYLDADTIFLRDWEELWGWKGAFAYRWSDHRAYNTAVLRMNKGSALGSFLLRTALRNGLDFHPMTISHYMRDAHLEGLLLQLPDALFDSAWLNTEGAQLDRPPFPHLTKFLHLLETPPEDGAQPQASGFDGFYKGAFSYHFHNFWWRSFDPSRNWPDLGLHFLPGELVARKAAGVHYGPDGDNVIDDKRDLNWAAVLKRTFEAYIRGERPNMYGEWLAW